MLKVSASPHITSSMTTQKVMLYVIIALLPSLVTGIVMFGIKALILTLVCIAGSVAMEGLCRIIMKREQTITDLSAAVTGMLLAMNLPPELPLWQALIGCFVAVVIAKQLFGGLGQNFANPAILGRIVLMLSFTSNMTSWTATKFMEGVALSVVKKNEVSDPTTQCDAVTGATLTCNGVSDMLKNGLGEYTKFLTSK